ncbi:hypothetical protein [Microbacterium sp. KUDC0406]|uniref:hypothetical protein n=1 Tax=Microbacterium sp. KUDC0406 TaxID=2909588 RepID=UPI0022A785B4|nr:hypothetical protein [Microbacterium sp. KUDC0406]
MAASLLQVWAAPALMRGYGLSELDVGNMMGAVLLVGGIVGALVAAWLIELLRRRNRRGALAIGIGSALLGAAGVMALMPDGVSAVIVFGAGVAASAFVGTAVPAFLMLYLPNELRGLAGGALILFSVGTGATIGPSFVAAVSGMLGGDASLALAMAATGSCAGILALLFFALLARLTRGHGAVAADDAAADAVGQPHPVAPAAAVAPSGPAE